MTTVIDLRPKNADILVRTGDEWALKVTVTNPDGTPLNLTGITIAANVTDSAGVVTSLNATVTDAAGGVFTIGQTAAVSSGKYAVTRTESGEVRTWLSGSLRVSS